MINLRTNKLLKWQFINKTLLCTAILSQESLTLKWATRVRMGQRLFKPFLRQELPFFPPLGESGCTALQCQLRWKRLFWAHLGLVDHGLCLLCWSKSSWWLQGPEWPLRSNLRFGTGGGGYCSDANLGSYKTVLVKDRAFQATEIAGASHYIPAAVPTEKRVAKASQPETLWKGSYFWRFLGKSPQRSKVFQKRVIQLETTISPLSGRKFRSLTEVSTGVAVFPLSLLSFHELFSMAVSYCKQLTKGRLWPMGWRNNHVFTLNQAQTLGSK